MEAYTDIKAPGGFQLRIVGAIYIALSVIAIVFWLNESADVPWFSGFFTLFVGLFGMLKGSDLSKGTLMLALALISLGATIVFEEFSFSFEMLLLLALPFLFLHGALKSFIAHKQLQLHKVSIKQIKTDESDPPYEKLTINARLKILGRFYIAFGVIGIGHILFRTILAAREIDITLHLLGGLLLLLMVPGFVIFTGYFAATKSNDLKSARKLRIFAVINFSIIVIGVAILGPIFMPVAVVASIIPLVFLLEAHKNATEHEKLKSAKSKASMRYVYGNSSFIGDDICVHLGIMLIIVALLSEQVLGAFAACAFVAASLVVRFVVSYNNNIIVDNIGVCGKINKVPFRLTYHEIIAISATGNASRKTLTIASGDTTHSIRVKNADAVRDIILRNKQTSAKICNVINSHQI